MFFLLTTAAPNKDIILSFFCFSELQERQTHDHNEPPKIAAKETSY